MPKIAIVTDIHAAARHGKKYGDQAHALLEQTIKASNHAGVELLLDLGDRINDISPETDKAVLASLLPIFRQASAPRAHLLGNHDVVNLSVEENAKLLETELDNRVIAIGDWDIVLWYCNPALHEDGWHLLDTDLLWLEQVLSTPRRSVVFTHAPFAGTSMLGNHYFEDHPHLGGYAPSKRLRAILSNSRLELCVSGHCHWNTLTCLDGVRHITVQSLTEEHRHQAPAQAWALLELGAEIRLEVFGADSVEYRLPLRF